MRGGLVVLHTIITEWCVCVCAGHCMVTVGQCGHSSKEESYLYQELMIKRYMQDTL